MIEPVTGADLAAYTQGQVSAGDPVAEQAVADALAAVRSYCGWHVIGRQTETLTVNGNGFGLLTLRTMHVVDVIEVREFGELVPADAYRWSDSGMLRKKSGRWPDEFRCITVELTHGYERAADVRGVVLSVAAREATNPFRFTNQSVGGMSFGHAGFGLMADEYARLDPYRIGN